jgi:hypothetical protein
MQSNPNEFKLVNMLTVERIVWGMSLGAKAACVAPYLSVSSNSFILKRAIECANPLTTRSSQVRINAEL